MRNFGSAPAKAGEVLRMKVPYGEDLAGHTGPESCVGTREGDGEALDRPIVPSKHANMSFWDLKKLVERVKASGSGDRPRAGRGLAKENEEHGTTEFLPAEPAVPVVPARFAEPHRRGQAPRRRPAQCAGSGTAGSLPG